MKSLTHRCWKLGIAAVTVGVLALVGGCATGMKSHHNTNVVDYLYSETKDPVVTASIPRLSLPLRVGIAFVPGESSSPPRDSGYIRKSAFAAQPAFSLTEKKKFELMQAVAARFKPYAYVKSIELIPSVYLAARGGFTNLDQLRSIYGVDVIALLSYDQTQFTDEGLLSLTYWTLIGAYIFHGEKNDTHTMIDAAVYDIASRKMLFRAPGISQVKGGATLVNLAEKLRNNSTQGFEIATEQMIANLDEQLALFTERVKTEPEEYKLEYKPGYSGGGGGGSVDALFLAALLCAFGLRRYANTKSYICKPITETHA